MTAPILIRDKANNRWGSFWNNTGQWTKYERYARWLHKNKLRRYLKSETGNK